MATVGFKGLIRFRSGLSTSGWRCDSVCDWTSLWQTATTGTN